MRSQFGHSRSPGAWERLGLLPDPEPAADLCDEAAHGLESTPFWPVGCKKVSSSVRPDFAVRLFLCNLRRCERRRYPATDSWGRMTGSRLQPSAVARGGPASSPSKRVHRPRSHSRRESPGRAAHPHSGSSTSPAFFSSICLPLRSLTKIVFLAICTPSFGAEFARLRLPIQSNVLGRKSVGFSGRADTARRG